MASGRARLWTTWAGRLAALAVAVVIPACSGSQGGANSNPGLLWVSQSGTGQTSGNLPVTWISPNTGLGGGTIGVIQIVSSVDEILYSKVNVSTQPPPFNLFVAYIFGREHPISTDTSSLTITVPEGELLGHINGYRNMVMGNQANVGGNGQVAGSPVLPSFSGGTKVARAHCKHYVYFHNNQILPGEAYNTHPFRLGFNDFAQDPWHAKGLKAGVGPPPAGPAPNAEGDHVIFTYTGTDAEMTATKNPGMVTPLRPGMAPYNIYANQGRMGKAKIDTAPSAGEFSYSGLQYKDPLVVKDAMVVDDGALIVDFYPAPPHPVWSHICVGYWPGGANSFYWNILFIKNPNPAN